MFPHHLNILYSRRCETERVGCSLSAAFQVCVAELSSVSNVTQAKITASISQSLLFPCCLMNILGAFHPSGAFFSPARVQILFRSSSNRFCFFLPLLSSTRLFKNFIRFCSFLYLCRFIFRRLISKTFLHLRGVAEPSPSSMTGMEMDGSTFSSTNPTSSSGSADSRTGGRE